VRKGAEIDRDVFVPIDPQELERIEPRARSASNASSGAAG